MFEFFIFVLFALMIVFAFVAFAALFEGECEVAIICGVLAFGGYAFGTHSLDRLHDYKALEGNNARLVQVIQGKNMEITNLSTINSTLEDAIDETQSELLEAKEALEVSAVNLYNMQNLATQKSNALDKVSYDLRMQEAKYAQCDATLAVKDKELEAAKKVTDNYREVVNLQTNKLSSIKALLEK